MTSAPAAPGKYRDAPTADALLPQSIWRAPLVPAALTVTAGIVLDRCASPPLLISMAAAVGGLAAWLCTSTAGHRTGLPLVYLALAAVAFGAGYHHYRRDFAADDVSHLAAVEPQAVQVRGFLDEEPFYAPAPPPDPLRSLDPRGHTASVLRLAELHTNGGWIAVSGRARLLVEGTLPDLHVGDEVEVVGRLSLPSGPSNPGEFDYAESLRDQGIGVVISIRKTAGVTRLGRGWTASPRGWLAVLRGWGQEALGRYLPPMTRGVGIALLLGDGAPMTREDWDKYLRTGVIHVLAISGQHLVVLAAFLWYLLPRLGVRQRHAAVTVALFLLVYSLLTGGRPPVMRSAVAVCAVCGALVLRRRVLKANLFALAWLVVTLLNPTDLFGAGCQLSFLSVAVLAWGTGRQEQADDSADRLARLVEQSRPAWQRGLLWLARKVGEAYAISVLIWLAVTPLAASRFHVVPPAGILLGPPLVLLTSLALLFGFALLLAAAICPPLAAALGLVVGNCLAACEVLVDTANRWAWGQWYVGDIPEWWLWIFYLGLLAVLTQGPLRRHWRAAMPAGLGWLCVGLLAGAARVPEGELRCTFLAVGHGGCTVLEAPDGRVLIYDTGALGGPDVTRRQIAPYLWTRGIRRVDEVLLSHADLDHFNGLESLLNYFAVGQVTSTPTFADKTTPGVRHTLAVLAERGVPLRVVKAGDVLTVGDVRLEVLHPPASGPEGNENSRSLVLQVRHAGHALLLTGDLEGVGQEMVLDLPARHVEVLMAPHHGSPAANPPGLARWARPQVVVASQEQRPGPRDGGEAYRNAGARYLSTAREGAVTIRSHASGLVVETFRTGERFVVRSSTTARRGNDPP